MKFFDRLAVKDVEARAYKTQIVVRAMRIEGPFSVQTIDGVMNCNDGWLVIDAKGWPYPVPKEEFDKRYSPV